MTNDKRDYTCEHGDDIWSCDLCADTPIKGVQQVTPDIRRLIPKGMLGTCATVVDDLVDRLDTMEEIYVVVKDKDGTSQEYISGNLQGLTFALLVLQQVALEAL